MAKFTCLYATNHGDWRNVNKHRYIYIVVIIVVVVVVLLLFVVIFVPLVTDEIIITTTIISIIIIIIIIIVIVISIFRIMIKIQFQCMHIQQQGDGIILYCVVYVIHDGHSTGIIDNDCYKYNYCSNVLTER